MPEESFEETTPIQKNSKEEEVFEGLISILKNSKPDVTMGLDQKSLDIIRQNLNKLSFNEKANLFMNFLTPTGTILYDAGGVFKAQIKIDDTFDERSETTNKADKFKERIKNLGESSLLEEIADKPKKHIEGDAKKLHKSRLRPLAYIKFTYGKKARVEVIDILESVRSDATLIGHPAIVFAIDHWQKILAWKNYSQYDDVHYRIENNKSIKNLFYDPYFDLYVERARLNLEAIGKALLEGARRQAIQKESAFVLKVQDLRLEEKNSYLFIAWKRLAKRHINETHELEERIDRIEKFLKKLSISQSPLQSDEFPPESREFNFIESTISISNVIGFLKTEGKHFVYDEGITDDRSLRPQWRVFHSAFIKWYFQKEALTVEQYRKIAKKKEIGGRPYTIGMGNSLPKTDVFNLMFSLFTQPLKNVCPPIECSEKIANSHRFADLINQTDIK